MSKRSIKVILASADVIREAWVENPGYSVGKLSRRDFEAALAAVTALDQLVRTRRSELGALIAVPDELVASFSNLVTEAKSGFRAQYGPDSVEYKQAGGIRTSERKPYRRAAKIKTATVG